MRKKFQLLHGKYLAINGKCLNFAAYNDYGNIIVRS